LVEGVPHGELKLVSVATGRDFNGDLDQMALAIGEGNGVVNGTLGEADPTDKNEDHRGEATVQAHR
jgi:hypothetical protein